jgi:hypothetical protein
MDRNIQVLLSVYKKILEWRGPELHCPSVTYRMFNLKVDRQLSRKYFTSDAIYNGSAGMTL